MTTWDTMVTEVARTFDVPRDMLVLPWENEHLIPFGLVTPDRIAKGVWYWIDDGRRSSRDHPAWDWTRKPLTGVVLYMHPADLWDFLRSEVHSSMAEWVQQWAYPVRYDTPRPNRLFGTPVDLFTTTDPAVVRRGRPRLVVNNTLEILL